MIELRYSRMVKRLVLNFCTVGKDDIFRHANGIPLDFFDAVTG